VTGQPTAGDPNAVNDYRIELREDELGWEVRILEPAGQVVWSRSCSDQAEARTLASTVGQHIYWLSPEKFREYYKLPEAG
jgi:hypothetical protein